MVRAVTTFGRSGLSDWLVQRISAVVLAAYLLFILGFIVAHPGLTYAEWKGFFSHFCVRVFSLAALLSLVAHGWIGLWGVVTDYLTTRLLGAKALFLRLLVLGVFALVTLAYSLWAIQILWGLN